MNMFLVLLGPPGAGKGTQAEKICERYKLPHIATGDILRQNIRQNTPLGLDAAGYIKEGRLVPDEIVTAIVKSRLNESDCKKGWLLDGFPRTLKQAQDLDSFASPAAVINLSVDEDALIRRITGRRICADCGKVWHVSTLKDNRCNCGGALCIREDDNEQALKVRLKAYAEMTASLIRYYDGQRLLTVDGMADIETVWDSVRMRLDRLQKQ